MSKSPQWWGRNTSSITWWAWIGKPCRKMTPSYSMCWNGNDAIVTRMPRRIRTTPIDVPLRNTCWPWSTHMMSRHTAKGRRTWPFSTICCSSMTNHKAAKICHFGRKSNSLVTKTTIKEMLGAKRQRDSNGSFWWWQRCGSFWWFGIVQMSRWTKRESIDNWRSVTMPTHQLSGKILSYIVAISYIFVTLFLFIIQSRGNQVRLLVHVLHFYTNLCFCFVPWKFTCLGVGKWNIITSYNLDTYFWKTSN